MIPRGVSLHLGLRVFIHVFLNFVAGAFQGFHVITVYFSVPILAIPGRYLSRISLLLFSLPSAFHSYFRP